MNRNTWDDTMSSLPPGMAEDATEHDRAQELSREYQARQRQRLVDVEAIALSLAHDLRSPLGTISLEAYMLLEQAKRDGTVDASHVVPSAQRIMAEVQRLEGFINDFLNSAPEQHLDRKTLNVLPLLQSVVTSWSAAASERHVSLGIACPDDVPSLSADEERIRRVFDNLIRNALEAIDQGPGRVDIEVSLPGHERVQISVRDTGPGIPENVQVFRIFQTTKTEGLGLGLALVRQIVLAHGGTIWHEDLRPHGTVFHLQLRCEC